MNKKMMFKLKVSSITTQVIVVTHTASYQLNIQLKTKWKRSFRKMSQLYKQSKASAN